MKAKLEELGRTVASARADVDDVQADAKLAALQARLDAVSKKVASPRIDEAGASKALADVLSVEAALDRLGEKDVTAKADVDTAEATVKTDELDAKVDEFGRKRETATLNVNTSGADFAGMMGMAKWPAIIAGIGAALPVIPAGLAAVASGGGVAALAMAGFGKALSDGSQAAQQAGQSSAQLAQTELSNSIAIASAEKAVSDAKTQQAHDVITSDQQIASAEQSLADAQRTAAQDEISSAESVARAEQSLASAQQSEQQAQENLTQAREDATRTLQQYANSQADAQLQAKQAQIDLDKAIAANAATQASSTATDLDKQQAALNVAEAQQRLTEANQAATNATQDNTKAQAEGVNGLPAVVSAQQAVAAAAQGTANAQQSLADAQRAQAQQQQADAERIANAQTALANAQQQASWTQQKDAEQVASAVQNLSDTYKQQQLAAQAAAASGSSASSSFAKDMAGLTGAGQAVVKMLLQVKTGMGDLEKAAESAVAPGLLTFLQGAQSLLPVISGEVQSMGGIIGQAFADVGRALQSSGFRSELRQILAEGNQLAQVLIPAVNGVIGAFLRMGAESGPAVSGLGAGLAAILRGVSDLFAQLAPAAPALGQVFASLGQIIGSLGAPIGALVAVLASGLGPGLKMLAPLVAQVGQLIVQLSPALLTLTAAMIKVYAAIEPVLPPLIQLTADILVPLANIIAVVASLLSGQFASGLSQAEGGLSGMVSWGGRVLDFFRQMPGQIAGFFAGLYDFMLGIGGNIIIGLWNGIVAKFNSMIGSFLSIPQDIIGMFKSALGIASPSKVFHGLGLNVTQGLAQGVDAGQPQVRTSMARMSANVAAGGPAAGAAGAGGYGGGGSVPALVIQPGAGGSGLEAQFWAWLRNGVRDQGGDPSMFQRKVAFAS